jgi:8-oxo-dGTP pyrophosphatase MutT (NUDIX family)
VPDPLLPRTQASLPRAQTPSLDTSFDPLLALYGELATVVRRAGQVYPAAVECHRGSPIGLAKLADSPLWIDPPLRAGGQRHLREVAARSPRMHDGQVLACLTTDGFPLMCATGGYFDAIATSDSLRAEYVERMMTHGEGSHTDLDTLPLRRRAHEACAGDALRRGRGRVAAVGVSVAVTLPSPSGRVLLLGLRSATVATDPGMWHVAPSGTLEHDRTDSGAGEAKLEAGGTDLVLDVVERELSEELGVHIDAAQLSARLSLLGIGYDLLRLRPEICLRLDLLERDLPSQGPLLDLGEFQSQRLIGLSQSSMSEFWASHPPRTLTPAATATIALMEAAEKR